jgi:FkbM family methyltransferase
VTLTDRLLAKLPIVGTKIQRLQETLTTSQGEVSRLETQVQMLTSQLSHREVELATLRTTVVASERSLTALLDANIARVKHQEEELATLRTTVAALERSLTALLVPAGAAADGAGRPIVAELMRQCQALALPTEPAASATPADGQPDNPSTDRPIGLHTLYEHLAQQYRDTVQQRDSLSMRVNALSGALQEARRSGGDRLALAEINSHLTAPFPKAIRAVTGVLPVTVVDVGAQMLVSEDHVYARLLAAGGCRVIGFEAMKEAADKRTDAEPGIQMLNYFIGKGGPATFRVTCFDAASSLFEPNLSYLGQFYALAEMCTPVEEHAVETTRLDDITEAADCDYLKIDVQGGELDVLRGAEALLARALYVHTEVEFAPVYRDQPLFSDVDRFLQDHGFDLLDLTKLGHSSYAALPGQQSRSKLLWADAIYVKRTDLLAAQGPAALLKAAYIAHVNYGMIDFAAHLITSYDQGTGSALAPDYLAQLRRFGV